MSNDPKDWLNRAIRAQRQAQYELDTIFNIQAKVDEVSIFISPQVMDHFVDWATDHGLNHFNSVPRDLANRLDGIRHESFDVRFEFFYMPGKDWRIEAMSVLGGYSAVHHYMKEGQIPHASFKVPDLPSYVSMKTMLEDQFNLRAEYLNSYGRFAYYGIEDRLPYFKPRVNLRDNQPSS